MSAPGQQGPRTALSWRRTALTAWAVAALGVHVAADSGRTSSGVAAGALVLAALVVSAGALARSRGLAVDAPRAAPAMLTAVALAVVLAVLAGALLVAWDPRT